MNYRHIYHAGNFADVFKHVILTLLINKLLTKEKPFCYVDTHAGIGCYNLKSKAAQKTLEYQSGITALFNCESDNSMPNELSAYFNTIKTLNGICDKTQKLNKEDLQFYPGSPYLVRSLLRPCDRMILMELQAEDFYVLKQLFKQDQQVAVHHYDGYLGLKAFLPPVGRRGVVLIDPPFEDKNEFERVLTSLKTAYLRFKSGIYALWYPLKDFTSVANFRHYLIKSKLPHLISELTISKQSENRELVGCGMAIINPPWQFDLKLKKILPWVWQRVSLSGVGGVKVYSENLTP